MGPSPHPRGTPRRQASLEQGLVEHERSLRGPLLLQTEDKVPEIDPRDPLSQLLSGGGGRRAEAGAARRLREEESRRLMWSEQLFF